MTTESNPSNDDSSAPDSSKRKIKIGTQRAPYVPPVKHKVASAEPSAPEETAAPAPEVTPETETSAEPAADAVVDTPPAASAESAPPILSEVSPPAEASQAAIPVPQEAPVAASKPHKMPSLDAMGDDLEAEIAAALGDMSLDDIIAGENAQAAANENQLEPDTRVKATVLRVHRDNVFFDLGVRNEGIALLKMFGEGAPESGTKMDVIVARFDTAEGLYEVHIPGAATSVGNWSDISEGVVIEVVVTGHNKGGLECEVSKIRGFIPASHVSLYRVEDLEQFVGQKLACVVTEANPDKGNLVLSHRAVLEREREASMQQLMQSLEVGQIHDATVRNIREFGAFCDLGGVDGLIHISKLSWDRVGHPSEVVEEGEAVKVKIESIDPETGKIGLSLRDQLENPWTKAEQTYPVGSVVSGTVTRIAAFGAFVKLEPGIEGLVHISELAHHRVSRVNLVVKEGQDVQVKVTAVDTNEQRIGLSMKATTAAPTNAKDKPEEELPPQVSAVPKHEGPLKGGFDKPSGGEGVGLNW